MLRLIALKAAALVVTGALLVVAAPKPADAWMCVTHVRNMTGITTIRGDAWAWWHNAEGQFARGALPTPGAIMVWRRAGNLPLGHVGVVREIVDSRTVLVDHSWDSNALRTDQPVVDVSANNDWSRVSVWYHPRQVMGSEYQLYGFVYPPGTEPSAEAMAEIATAQQAEQAALTAARDSVTRQLEAAGRIGSERHLTATATVASTTAAARTGPITTVPAVARGGAPSRDLTEASRRALEVVRANRARMVAARSGAGPDAGPDAGLDAGETAAPTARAPGTSPVDPAVLAARARELAGD